MKILIYRFLTFSLVLLINFSVLGQISVKEEMKIVQREFYKAKKERVKTDSTVFDSTKITQTKTQKKDIDFVCRGSEPVATFEGGMDNFYKLIGKNLKLAEKPKEIGSRVLIEFVIDTTGKMTDFKILKSDFSKKNNDGFLQLLESINSTYTWKPAVHKGQKVFFRMSLPIKIHLE